MNAAAPLNRTTGPVDVPDAVMAALSGSVPSHRSERFKEMFARVGRGLAEVAGAHDPPVVLTTSGTGAIEAAVANVVQRDARVLVLVVGHYGELLREIAARYSDRVESLTWPWGQPVDVAHLRERLAASAPDVVLATHSESSTGVLNPLADIARAVRETSDALLVVDAVGSLAAAPVDMDRVGADVVVGASQKALACPPGVAFVFLGPRARRRLAAGPAAAVPFYLDLARYLSWLGERTTPFTPAVHGVMALDAALELIRAETLPRVHDRHARTAGRCRERLRDHGLEVLATEGFASPSVTAVRLPEGTGAREVQQAAAAAGILVASGIGPHARTMVRIGHMGFVDDRDIDRTCATVGELAGRTRTGLHR